MAGLTGDSVGVDVVELVGDAVEVLVIDGVCAGEVLYTERVVYLTRLCRSNNHHVCLTGVAVVVPVVDGVCARKCQAEQTYKRLDSS